MEEGAKKARRTRVEPYIYRAGRQVWVRLSAVAGARQRVFHIDDYRGEDEAVSAARAWRDSRATPAMKAAITRAREGARASTMRSVSRSKAAKTGIRLVKSSGLLIAFDVHCSMPNGGKPISRRFRVEHHDEEAALLFAVRQRLAWEARHWGVTSAITDGEWAILVARWVRHHPGEPFAPELLDHPGAVTEPYPNLFQARVMIAGEKHSRTFHPRNYASVWEARLAAIVWLMSFEERTSRPKLYTIKARSGGGSRTGVSRSIRAGRRGGKEVVYQVTFKDPATGAQRNKNFNAGALEKLTPEKEDRVAMAARAFRAAYEAWVLRREPFDPSDWSNWREAFGVPSSAERPSASSISAT